MKKNKMLTRLFVSLGVISFIFSCIIILMYLKPDGTLPSSTAYFETLQTKNQPVASTIKLQDDQPVLVESNMPQLIEQRDELYHKFGQISFEMIEGQKPDLRNISVMLKEHHQLVESGVISVQDAENYLDFLKKVFPEMESELNHYINQLTNIAHKNKSS